MKQLALGALLAGLLVACGGDDTNNNNNITIIADGSNTGPMTCNPLTQAGCATGEKCTWLLDALMPQYVGHVGCAPVGTAQAGDACMYGAPGASGYDNCAAGLVCGNYRGGTGTCKTICDQQGGQPTCASTHVCVTYSGLFSTGDTTPPAGGVCDLACDPLADNDFDGSGTISAKGSNTCGSAASVGCYGYPSYGTPPATGWSCTNDINFETAQPEGLRHRVQCTDANMCTESGGFYINSCNQGYLPLLYEMTGSMTVICVAMCRPAVCYNGACTTSGNTVTGANGNRDGARPHECSATNRVPGGNFTNTEHCQYLWWREIDDSGNLLSSTTSDTLGFCFDMSKYQYDSDNDNQADTNLPNCDTLGSGFGSGSNPAQPTSYFGALDLGCVPTTYLPAAANGKPGIPADQLQKRSKIDLPRALYRRQMAQ